MFPSLEITIASPLKVILVQNSQCVIKMQSFFSQLVTNGQIMTLQAVNSSCIKAIMRVSIDSLEEGVVSWRLSIHRFEKKSLKSLSPRF